MITVFSPPYFPDLHWLSFTYGCSFSSLASIFPHIGCDFSLLPLKHHKVSFPLSISSRFKDSNSDYLFQFTDIYLRPPHFLSRSLPVPASSIDFFFFCFLSLLVLSRLSSRFFRLSASLLFSMIGSTRRRILGGRSLIHDCLFVSILR